MDIKDFDKYFARLSREVQRQISTDLPRKIGNLGVRMFKRNFRDQGFFGQRWQDVKRRTNPGKGKKSLAAARHPILTGSSGNLGRSIHFTCQPGKVIVQSDLPYSSAHNYGTNNAGRSHNVHIPQRQFIGEHPQLESEIEKLIEKELLKAFDK